MRKTLHLTIPESEWEPNAGLADPLTGLIGPTLVINGLSMHVEAWQVTTEPDADFPQEPASDWIDEYESLHAAVHADGSFQTLRLFDRDYIVVISPFSE